MTEIIIIGGGHNGLAAAFYLAKAGLKPTVFEQRDEVGGGAITTELHPGFRCPTLTHHTPVWRDVAADMDLHRHGLEWLSPAVDVLAPRLEGPPLVLADDPERTAQLLRPHSANDANAYAGYRSAITQVAAVLASQLQSPPPRIDGHDAGDLWRLLQTGYRVRRLGRQNAHRLLRWIPMPVADLVSEWFESDSLRASIAASGLSGTMLAPRSAGSALVLLLHEAHRLLAGGSRCVRGGPGVLASAMAASARAAGADIHTGTRVDRIVVDNSRTTAVIVNGREMPAGIVVSAVDPKTTYLKLVDAAELSPEFRSRIHHYRCAGSVAKVNLALSGLPAFPIANAGELSGRIHIGPDLDYLEHAFDDAKYGRLPEQPWLDVTIPSVLDPGLAPSGAHVMSIYAHYAPYSLRGDEWSHARDVLLDRVLAALEPYAPGLRALVVAAEVITPPDLEAHYGFHGGHIFHGELALDQLLISRPLLGYSRYDSPVRGLYLCGAGTHPGGFLTGASGKLAAREIIASLGIDNDRSPFSRRAI